MVFSRAGDEELAYGFHNITDTQQAAFAADSQDTITQRPCDILTAGAGGNLRLRLGRGRSRPLRHVCHAAGGGVCVAKEFKRIFACSFLYNNEGEAEWPGVAVDYTAKTQFLFKINKGILSVRDNKKVNESKAEDNKRIPFPHMIYFGDGETDVPCMKIVKMFGGNSIGVYNPDIKKKVNVARKLLRQQRVNFITPADYTKESRTYEVVCAIIDKIKADFDLAKLAKVK